MNSNSSIISDTIVDIDAKSEGEHLDKQVLFRHLSDDQHNYHNIYRRYSLPEQSEDSHLRVIELGLNINMAEVVLNSLDPEEFTESSENRILNKVISALLLTDQINEIQDRQGRKSRYRELKQIIGKTNPNLMGYLGYVDQSASLSQSMIQRLCSICYDSYEESSMVEVQGCQHSFCLDCYKSYLTQRIMNGYADKMTCPAGGCIERISDEYIRELLGEDMFNKMNKFRKIKRLAHETDITWCPRQGCEEFVQKKSNGKMVVCQCGQEICTSCGRAYHDDISCNNQLENDFNKAIRKFKIQKCAKCKSPIQKNDGCNHMTCYHCEYEFCWLCRSKSSSRHYDPYNIFGCPGMQFSHRDPFRFPNLYRFLVIIAIIILGPPAAVIALIFGFIAVVIGLPAIGYMTWVSHSHFDGYSKCRKALVIIGLTVACIVLSPLSLILVCLAIVALILFSIPYSIYMIIQYI